MTPSYRLFYLRSKGESLTPLTIPFSNPLTFEWLEGLHEGCMLNERGMNDVSFCDRYPQVNLT